MNKVILTMSALALTSLAASAHADDLLSPWFIRAGVADIDLSNKLDLAVAGQPVAGAALHFHQVYTPMAEIGYSFDEDWAAVATVGLPPHTGAYGSGTIAPYGKLEATTFGPTALTVQYQPIHFGIVRPYVGAGISYMIIFSTSDAAVQNAKLTNDLAPALEVGSDFAINEEYGLFVEAKKAFLQSNTTGNIGGYPITGKASLDPWVFSAGATLHF